MIESMSKANNFSTDQIFFYTFSQPAKDIRVFLSTGTKTL